MPTASGDLSLELAPCPRVEEVAHAGAREVGAERTVGPDQIRHLVRRQQRPARDDDDVQTDPQVR
jgi:hypothetical protein